MKRYFINDNWSTYKDSNALFFDLQFAFKGGFNVVRKLLENEELDAPVSTLSVWWTCRCMYMYDCMKNVG